MKRIYGLILIVLGITSCNNVESWYPTGSVSIESYREYIDLDTGTKACLVNYKITNTGNSSIDKSTFFISLKTDKGTYVSPEILEVTVQPNKSILNNKVVTYIDATHPIGNIDSIIITS